ncbi:malate dehydrogenase (quinone) [Rahnella sp. BIGb0236]|uniref:malate dehydrogenase (quinone) n=1 Tax=Rahnella sp. BIGb0236 TaxID=2485117 RepID=UPI00105F8C77|nr:malate dehydrogenase (quinone) [Rahnella sp. BIGb0236]TDS93127.1 malate dehydrogenase (quinone) [Rahnella sp. BIGb0236]
MRKILGMLLNRDSLGASEPAAAEDEKSVDVLLVGGGIMSATLGTYLRELEPDWSIHMIERMDSVAQESSNGWNNAGTGHAALAEMNYTPLMPDGSVDITKAVAINEAFQVSRQFMAYQVQKGVLNNPRSFINSVPHMSFVWGDENIDFLRKRFAALQESTLFRGMEYSEDPELIKQWIPAVMEGRDPAQKVAATRTTAGTDVNFGEVTRQLVEALQKQSNFTLANGQEVRDIQRNPDKTWRVTITDLKHSHKHHVVNAKFVFIGAGGASLTLLQKSGIPEAREYGGFPVGGEFLVTENQDVVKRHLAKVYGKAAVGAPPMSVPHLDTRIIDGKQVLLFGPFATFSSKFLKNGSLWDLFGSVNSSNLLPMTHVGVGNFDLVKYLVGQVMLSDEDRHAALKEFFPQAEQKDWKRWVAGQRVQVIKKDGKHGGVLRLGTEVVSAKDGSIAALLGASPGASTAAPIMMKLLETVFKEKAASAEWQAKFREIIPSYGTKLNGNVEATEKELLETSRILGLETPSLKTTPVADVVQLRPLEAQAKQEPKQPADIAL